MAIAPNKANSPLIVNPNGVLAFPVTTQSLQVISGRRCKHAEFRRSVQLQ